MSDQQLLQFYYNYCQVFLGLLADINLNMFSSLRLCFIIILERLNTCFFNNLSSTLVKALTYIEAFHKIASVMRNVTGPKDQGTVMPRFLVTSAL